MAGPLSWTPNPMINLEWYMAGDQIPRREILGPNNTRLLAQVVVDEDHEDDLVITEHPISGGAVVHDHAFKRPASVRLRMGWSTAYLQDVGVSSVRELYEQMLALQASRIPCVVYTGKREYQNMLVASLRTHTDASLEFSIIAEVEMREIVLTSTSAWTLSSINYNQGALASPDSNSQTINTGQINLLPATVQVNYIPSSFGGHLFDLPTEPGQTGAPPMATDRWVPMLPHVDYLPDRPADPQQAVFHPPPSRIYGP